MLTKAQQRLVEEALAIEAEDARQTGALGYMANVLAKVSLPYTDPGTTIFKRKNGNLTLTVSTDEDELGLPYGPAPRLIMAWISTMAVQRRTRHLNLGNNMIDFMRSIGVAKGRGTGGANGNLTNFRKQAQRLFAASISAKIEDPANGYIEKIGPLPIATRSRMWWNPRRPNEDSLWESELILGGDFYEELIANPVPINLDAMKALKGSALALDIYVWLTYRYFTLTRPRVIPWESLAMQFGSTFSRDRDFRKKFAAALGKVLVVYPSARIREAQGGLLLTPSPTHIQISE